MTNNTLAFTAVTDEQLLATVRTLAQRERVATVQLIAALAELDARRLYLGQGYSSLFTYCTHALQLSEHAAYARIEAARAVRRYPIVLDLLAEGALTLTTVCLLARHLTPENHRTVLDAARHQSKREVERQVAALHPLPPVLSSIRKLPAPPLVATRPDVVDAPAPSATVLAASNTVVIKPLAPERYKVQLLTLLLDDLLRKKTGQTEHPRRARAFAAKSRHVPRVVRREVWKRDGGQCAFVGAAGRCTERGLLEFHHVVPVADDGPPTSVNVQLRCRAHNAYEAQLWFSAWR